MSDFHDPIELQKTLGEYWYGVYSGEAQITDYLESLCNAQKQSDTTLSELVAALSRKTIPLYRKQLYYPLWINQSDYETGCNIHFKHDGELTYNRLEAYNSVKLRENRIQIPEKLKSIGKLSNSLINPVISIENPVVIDNFIAIDFDPFDGDFRIETVADPTGGVVDKKALIWLQDVEIDCDDLYTEYGYQFGLKLNTSQFYKDLLNTLYDAVIDGPAEDLAVRLVKVVTGLPEVEIFRHTDEEIPVPALVVNQELLSKPDIGYILAKNRDFRVNTTVESGRIRLDIPLDGDGAGKFNDYVFAEGLELNIEETDPVIIHELQKLTPNRDDCSQEFTPVSETYQGGFRDIQQLVLGR